MRCEKSKLRSSYEEGSKTTWKKLKTSRRDTVATKAC